MGNAIRFSNEVEDVISAAIDFANQMDCEFITPEIILYAMTDNSKFVRAFENCFGNIDNLKTDLVEFIEEDSDCAYEDVLPVFSEGTRDLLDAATDMALNANSDEISLRHLVYGYDGLYESYAVYLLEKNGVNVQDLFEAIVYDEADDDYCTAEFIDDGFDFDYDMIAAFEEENNMGPTPEKNSEPNENGEYAPLLNTTLKDINPLIGREVELNRTIQVLCRKDKNNPLHLGEPGVGKTAITHGLVKKIIEGDVPPELKGAKVFSLDLGGMIAGTQYRGEFEKRLKKVLADIGKEEKPIIYIDEIHNLCGAGATSDNSLDAANILKPYLAEGHIRFIGATTFEEYKKHFEKDKSMVRRFQNIEVNEPTDEETVEIINGLLDRYEKFHGVKYEKGIVEYVVAMSRKYINERFLPDKAIDLIDEAGAHRKLHPTNKKVQTVDKEVINEVLTSICRVPVESVNTNDVSGLKNLEKKIKSKIYGQDEAVTQVVNAVKFSKAGLSDETKPLASLLFVGPTGVGKTEIVKTLANELGVKLIRFDMSEYGEKHAVAKLIGSPAGYVGYEEGGLLTETIRKNPNCVLLLDEIEKAHPDIYNILLQVMDYATLTDNQGRKADFRNVILVMTSNAGASLLGKSGIGFNSTDYNSNVIEEAVKRTFQPEFRNRLNKIVVFNSMNDFMAKAVIDKKVSELSNALSVKNIQVSVTGAAKTLLMNRGISKQFGAREVDRVINNDIKPLMVDEILFGKLTKGGKVTIDAKNNEFSVNVESLSAKPKAKIKVH